MNFKEELKQKTARAEQVIASFLPKEEGFAKHMAEAMNYSMRAGGKRLRPVFMAEMYELLGGNGRSYPSLYGGYGDDSHPFSDS